jgi:flavodoxin
VLTGEKYPSSYGDTVAVAQRELRRDSRPAIEPVDVSEYDEIILIYPLWWGTVPMPVATFLESGDFTGKTIYLIASQGSSGFGASAEAVRALCPGATVREGISVYCDDIPKARDEIGQYLQSILP